MELIPLDVVRSLSPGSDLAAARRLAAIVRGFRPDLVHTHGSKAGVLARAARVATPRVPLVHTPHGYAFAGYFTSGAERLAYKLIERAVSPLASRVLCVCEAEARLAAQVGPRSRIRVVHNGFDPPATPPTVHPRVAELRAAGAVLTLVSGLRPGKGLETLAAALPAILERDPEATLVVVGDGPERADFERRLARSGVASRVEMLGEVADVAPVLAGSDLLLFPSWAESFPYAILEAMAFGLAIVATDVGGVGEAIVEGISGRLVPPRDPDALAEAAGAVLSDPEEGRRLGRTAHARVQERFSVSGMIAGTLGVYRELAS
jgi:glycosyltransferase involved in cell wall biosynthesis